MTTEKMLITIDQSTALQAFSSEDGLKPYIGQVKTMVDEFEHDLETVAGRKRSISLAANISKLKVSIAKIGKDESAKLKADLKTKIETVDGSRKAWEKELDELRDLARKPVTDWEVEQAEIEAEAKAEAVAIELAKEIESNHEIGLLLNEKRDAEIKAEAERIKAERVANEKRIADKAAADAKTQAEADAAQKIETANQEKIAADQREKNAKLAQENAEREVENLKKQIEADKKQAAIDKIESDRVAEASRLAAIESERRAGIARQEANDAADKAAQDARKKDRANVMRVRNQAQADLVKLGISDGIAGQIVMAIHNNEISNVSIKY